jgi:predicted nucleic acid-binding protein
MSEYFDSTVALSAIFAASTNYQDAAARIKAAGDERFIINHGLAEAYRTLTGRLKLPPKQAAQLVEGALVSLFKEANLGRGDYLAAIKGLAEKSLSGPIIYDAVHAQGARNVRASKVHTYNLDHFRTIAPDLNIV